MENNKLIGMREFVLRDRTMWFPSEISKDLAHIINYVKFLSKPLELGFFVPVKDGNVLEEPEIYKDWVLNKVDVSEHVLEAFDCVIYRAAKSRCLFEGFEYREDKQNGNRLFFNDNPIIGIWQLSKKTIEDLVPYGLTLTQTALKEINLK